MRGNTVKVGKFEWDVAKNAENQKKHGVDFFDAMSAFLDSRRVIAQDDTHSSVEPRFFCIGKVNERILSVRFVYRRDFIRLFGAGYW